MQTESFIMSDEKRIPEYGDDDLLTSQEIAELIGRTTARVRQLVKDLEIPHKRFGQAIAVKYKDLEPIFERNTDRNYRYPKDEE